MKKLFAMILAVLTATMLAVPAYAEPAQRISIGSDILMEQGAFRQLTVRYTPSNSDQETFDWSSSNELVVSVSDSGQLVAISAGNAVITARSASGLSASTRVTVRVSDSENTTARRLEITPHQLVMTEGTGRQLSVRYSPSSADRETLTWRSSDTSVATVDEYGYVTAVGRGSTIISVKSDSDLRSSVQVTVRKEGQHIKARELEMSMNSILMRVDQTRTLNAYFIPSDVSDKELEWSTANPDIATVTPEGDVVGVAPGTTTITATSYDGVTATCEVTVSGTLPIESSKDNTVNRAQDSSVTLTSAAARTEVENVANATKRGAVGIAQFKNKTKVSATVINAAAYSAKATERNVHLRFRTESEKGKLQGYLTFDPQKVGDISGSYGMAVYNSSSKAVAAQERFQKRYDTALTAIELSHSGSFGFEVKVVVKPTVSGLTTKDLHVFSYDPDTYKFKELATKDARVDKNGFVHFTTNQGGIFILSNGDLT